jgi:hypothetical protein
MHYEIFCENFLVIMATSKSYTDPNLRHLKVATKNALRHRLELQQKMHESKLDVEALESPDYGKSIDLSDLAKPSYLFVLVKARLPLTLSFLGLLIATILIVIAQDPTSLAFSKVFFIICSTLLFFTCWFWSQYRNLLKVSVSGFRLEVKRGVIKPITVSAALLPHTTFLLKQETWLDVALGLASIQVNQVNVPSAQIVRIPYLPIAKAEKLKNFLVRLIDQQLDIVK